MIKQDKTILFAAHDLQTKKCFQETIKNDEWGELSPLNDNWDKVCKELDSKALAIIFTSDASAALEMIPSDVRVIYVDVV